MRELLGDSGKYGSPVKKRTEMETALGEENIPTVSHNYEIKVAQVWLKVVIIGYKVEIEIKKK